MKIIITGGNGYLGQVLFQYFSTNHEVIIVGRHKPDFEAAFVKWDGETLGEWTKALIDADILINLAGKSVDCRYNDTNKRIIIDSRVNTTEILHEAISKLDNPPKVWLNAASATIYRHSQDKLMTEDEGEIGEGFSVEVCKAWEKAFFTGDLDNTRRVALRTTIVLGNDGGAFPLLKRLAKFGLGGKQGSGLQMFSWIQDLDFCRAVEHIIQQEELEGVINVAAPNPISNGYVMKSLRKSLGMLIGIPTPTWMLKIGAIFIGTETELILKSRYVYPEKLKNSNFEWFYKTVNEAFEEINKK